MSNREIYDNIAKKISKVTTHKYSTSFSLGIRFFNRAIRPGIYGIYGFVRFADEIVDTFFEQDQEKLLIDFRNETLAAINRQFSTNPILHAFQMVVNHYNISEDLIASFLDSMRMDIHQRKHSKFTYDKYVYGSAEVIGLMCMNIFFNGNKEKIAELNFPARKLGAAFQKVNFLRDLKDDYKGKGRLYFPELKKDTILDSQSKRVIEDQIEIDFYDALKGIKKLPKNSRFGVYLAYQYYRNLFNKLKAHKAEDLLEKRVRINSFTKLTLIPLVYYREKTGQFI